MLTDTQVQHGGWGNSLISQNSHREQQLICGELPPFGQRQLLWMLIPPYRFLRVEQACKWVTLVFSCLDKLIPSWFSAGRGKRIFLFRPYSVSGRAKIYGVTSMWKDLLYALTHWILAAEQQSGYYCLQMRKLSALWKMKEFLQIHIVNTEPEFKPRPTTCLTPKQHSLQYCSLPR